MLQDDIIELLSGLVSLGSVNPGSSPVRRPWQGEKQVAEYIRDWFNSNGLDVEMDEYQPGRCNVVAMLDKGRSFPTVLLEAHMDTVDIDWPDDGRFRPRLRDGCLWGLGACDDKGSLCALMIAARELAQSGRAARNVILAATGDEEFGFTGIRRVLSRGVKAKGAIICEPTRLNIVRRHKAILRWRVRFSGRSAHASTPHLGENAVYRAAAAVNALEELARGMAGRPASELLTAPTLSVGTIRGGRQVNSVPDWCEIEIDRRVLPEEDMNETESEIRDTIAAALPDGAGWEMDTILSDLPLDTSPDAWIVKAAEAACLRAAGSCEIIGENYGTDASKVSAAGIPSIVLGPGDPAVVHAPGEHIPIDEVHRAVNVFIEFLSSND